MAYLNMLMPITVDLTWVSGTGFSTDVVMMASGTEARNQNWAANVARYVVTYNARDRAGWEALDAFFQAAAGRANTWRLRDPRHNVATAAQGRFSVIDGTHNQMVVRYTFGAYTFDRPITKPDAAAVIVGGGSMDTTTGIVTGGAPTSWSGPFYICCRFDVDQLEITGIDIGANGDYIAGYRNVPIVEAKGE